MVDALRKPNWQRKSDWQKQGGSLTIPDNWFVDQADFDAEKPYIHIQPEPGSPDFEDYPAGKLLDVPKSLAYYLSVHFCGSFSMRDILLERGRNEVKNKIKEALGIEL